MHPILCRGLLSTFGYWRRAAHCRFVFISSGAKRWMFLVSMLKHVRSLGFLCHYFQVSWFIIVFVKQVAGCLFVSYWRCYKLIINHPVHIWFISVAYKRPEIHHMEYLTKQSNIFRGNFSLSDLCICNRTAGAQISGTIYKPQWIGYLPTIPCADSGGDETNRESGRYALMIWNYFPRNLECVINGRGF